MAYKRLSLIRGDSKTLTVTFKDKDAVPYCLKNWVVFFTLKSNYDLPDSQASLQKIITAFADSTSGTSGVAVISIDPTDTVDLIPGEYDYDIAVRTSSNQTFTPVRGKCEVEYDVTRTAGTAGSA
jgi:hypothetical protein